MAWSRGSLLVLLLVASAQGAAAQLPADLRELVARRDDAAALLALQALPAQARADAGAVVLEARLLERLGRLDEARVRWLAVDLARVPEPLRAGMRLRLARLEARTGRFADARSRALAITDPSLADAARALAAECALALGDAAVALDELSALSAGRSRALDPVALARLVARASAALGRPDDAATRLREAYLASPSHPDAEPLLAELVALAPARATFSTAERLALAASLVRARSYERALAALEPVRPADDAERAALAHARGEVFFAMRRYADAIPAYDAAIAHGASTAIDDAYAAARAANRLDDRSQAERRFTAFIAAFPADRRVADARLALATLALDDGRSTPMEALLGDPRAPRAHRGEAGLALALVHLAAGRAAPARAALGLACPLVRDEAPRLACRYFGAIAGLDDARDGAIAALESLATEQRDAHYGLLARRRLAALGRPFAAGARAAPSLPPAEPLPDSVAFLASLGLLEDAADELARRERDPELRGVPGRIRLVASYLALEDYGRAFRIARAAPALPEPVVLAASYPRAYADAVEPLAARFDVDPFYVYGTMRQESGFRADAVSRVSALGILQMMPATAARAAERAGVAGFEPTDLFAPRTSVGLALVEMGELRARYAGCLPLVAAGYNAGTAKVDAWLVARRGWPIDLFLEAIPFDETRGYVRRVVGHAAAYHALSGHPERGPTLYDACASAIAGSR